VSLAVCQDVGAFISQAQAKQQNAAAPPHQQLGTASGTLTPLHHPPPPELQGPGASGDILPLQK